MNDTSELIKVAPQHDHNHKNKKQNRKPLDWLRDLTCNFREVAGKKNPKDYRDTKNDEHGSKYLNNIDLSGRRNWPPLLF